MSRLPTPGGSAALRPAERKELGLRDVSGPCCAAALPLCPWLCVQCPRRLSSWGVTDPFTSSSPSAETVKGSTSCRREGVCLHLLGPVEDGALRLPSGPCSSGCCGGGACRGDWHLSLPTGRSVSDFRAWCFCLQEHWMWVVRALAACVLLGSSVMITGQWCFGSPAVSESLRRAIGDELATGKRLPMPWSLAPAVHSFSIFPNPDGPPRSGKDPDPTVHSFLILPIWGVLCAEEQPQRQHEKSGVSGRSLSFDVMYRSLFPPFCIYTLSFSEHGRTPADQYSLPGIQAAFTLGVKRIGIHSACI